MRFWWGVIWANAMKWLVTEGVEFHLAVVGNYWSDAVVLVLVCLQISRGIRSKWKALDRHNTLMSTNHESFIWHCQYPCSHDYFMCKWQEGTGICQRYRNLHNGMSLSIESEYENCITTVECELCRIELNFKIKLAWYIEGLEPYSTINSKILENSMWEPFCSKVKYVRMVLTQM